MGVLLGAAHYSSASSMIMPLTGRVNTCKVLWYGLLSKHLFLSTSENSDRGFETQKSSLLWLKCWLTNWKEGKFTFLFYSYRPFPVVQTLSTTNLFFWVFFFYRHQWEGDQQTPECVYWSLRPTLIGTPQMCAKQFTHSLFPGSNFTHMGWNFHYQKKT